MSIGQFGCQNPSPFLLLLLLPTKTFSKIAILWQKNRGDSESLPHPLRLGFPRFRGAGLWKIVGGSNDELEGYSGDEQITLIELTRGGFEDFGGGNGGRPFVAILADLRVFLGHEPCEPN